MRRCRSVVLAAGLLASAGVLGAGALGCSGPPVVEPAVAVPTAIAVTAKAAKPVPKERWRYHPPEMGAVVDGVRLPDRRWLLLDEGGERWLTEPLPEAPDNSKPHFARTSVYRAEPLTMVARVGKTWRFADGAGNIYRTDTPLGPLRLHTRVPKPMVALALSEKGAIGFAEDGRGFRFSDGAWSQVPALSRWPFEVAAAADGGLLAIAFPEQLLSSQDGGSSWQAIDAEPFGAYRLRQAAGGQIHIDGVGEARLWDGQQLRPAPADRRSGLPSLSDYDLQPIAGPSFISTSDGAAVLTGERYYEILAAGDAEASMWRLRHGRLGEALAVTPLQVPAKCEARLAAAGERVLLACLIDQQLDMALTLWRSNDGGKHFDQHASLRAATADVELAVNARGEALLTGVCARSEQPCAEGGAASVSAAGKVLSVKASDYMEEAMLPAFSLDGRRAYFVGRSKKNERPALFVSQDGARSFRARSLKLPKRDRRGWDNDDVMPSALHPGAGGFVGMLFDDARPHYVLLSAEGRVKGQAQLPSGVRAVAGAGRDILAAGTEGGSGELVLWESRDGGHRFERLTLPLILRVTELGEGVAPRCSEAGCFLGDRLTRLGWGPDEVTPPVRPRPRPEDRGSPVPELRTTLECTLADQPWQQLDDVSGAVLPDASVAMRGDSAWSVLRRTAKNELEAVSMQLSGSAAKLSRSRMFAPSRRKGEALSLAGQMEGYAAARARLPKAASGQVQVDLEVAWVNYATDVKGRSTVRRVTLAPADFSGGDKPTLRASLLSVSPKGFFVRASGVRPETVVLDVKGRELRRADYPSWPPSPAPRRFEDATLIGKTPLAVAMHNMHNGATAFLSTAPFGTGAARFMTLLPPSSTHRSETSWSYQGERVGLLVQAHSKEGRRSHAYFMPFEGSGVGPITPVPSVLDLKTPIQPCKRATRRTTPRVIASYVEGTRHPVLVHDGPDEHHLISEDMVLYGTPAQPCVAAWHAVPTFHPPHHKIHALIMAEPQQAWAFRRMSATTLSFRPMQCKRNPAAVVPEGYLAEPGVLRFR